MRIIYTAILFLMSGLSFGSDRQQPAPQAPAADENTPAGRSGPATASTGTPHDKILLARCHGCVLGVRG